MGAADGEAVDGEPVGDDVGRKVGAEVGKGVGFMEGIGVDTGALVGASVVVCGRSDGGLVGDHVFCCCPPNVMGASEGAEDLPDVCGVDTGIIGIETVGVGATGNCG